MNEQRLDMERVLDTVRTEIENDKVRLLEVQRELADSLGNRSVLLVDTLSGMSGHIKEGLKKLKAKGGDFDKLAQIYLEVLFGGKLPESAFDRFQQFLGNDVKLLHHRVIDEPSFAGEKIGAMVFSGSPADVSKAFDEEMKNANIKPGIEVTHGGVYTRTGELYREAVSRNIPVLGICYGHQRVTVEHGGTVQRDPAREEEWMSNIAQPDYGRELLVGVVGEEINLSGQVSAFHNEEIQPNPQKSALILHSTDYDPRMVHGLLHIANGEFSGKAVEDAQLVRELLRDKRHVALTVQGHPEEDSAQRLVSFSILEDLMQFEKTRGNILTKDILGIFTNFLKLYGEKNK